MNFACNRYELMLMFKSTVTIIIFEFKIAEFGSWFETKLYEQIPQSEESGSEDKVIKLESASYEINNGLGVAIKFTGQQSRAVIQKRNSNFVWLTLALIVTIAE